MVVRIKLYPETNISILQLFYTSYQVIRKMSINFLNVSPLSNVLKGRIHTLMFRICITITLYLKELFVLWKFFADHKIFIYFKYNV